MSLRRLIKVQSDVQRVTFSGRPQYVHFEHKCKTHLCGKVFNFSSPNVCVEKRPKNVLRTSQSDTRSVTSLWRHLIIINKIGF